VAFLGGPFAILLFSALNSRRLGRLGRDAWAYVLAATITSGLVLWLAGHAAAQTTPEALAYLGEGRRGVRAAARLFAIVLFGAFYLLHRRYHRAARLRGEDAPSPWLPGIAVSILGAVLATALVAVAMGVGG